MSAASNKKKGENRFDKILLRTLLGILCTLGFGLAVLGHLYWRSQGTVERLLGEWADILTPVTVIVALVCVGAAAVWVVMELVSLD